MIEQIISFETAKLAKEKGFNINTLYYYGNTQKEYDRDLKVYQERLGKMGEEECKRYFNKNYPLWCAGTLNDGTIHGYAKGISERIMFPTQAVLQKWLREKHDIEAFVTPTPNTYYAHVFLRTQIGFSAKLNCKGKFSSFEEALEMVLVKALELIT